MAEIVKMYERSIASVTLVPSHGGRFEVVVADTLLYSKLETRRHPEPGEVAGLIEQFLQAKTSKN